MIDGYARAAMDQHLARMRADNRRRYARTYVDCERGGLVDVGAYAFQGITKVNADPMEELSGPAQVIKMNSLSIGGRNGS